MLVEAETSNDKDFIALSALMRAATSLYRMDRQRPSYLQVRAIVFPPLVNHSTNNSFFFIS